MASCDPQTILAEQPCYSALMWGQRQWVKAQLLCNLKTWLEEGGDMASCDVQSLMDDAACLATLPAGQLDVVIAQLECDVNGLIGGGGSAVSFLCGSGSPEGVVIGLSCGQLYTDTDTGTKYTFTGTVGTSIGWV
jgi:hypothetical protein